MRLSNTQAVARPIAVDRNPVNRTQYVNTGAAAPHAFTSRWSYTVSVGKKAIVQMQLMHIARQTVAAPVGRASIQMSYTPNGGSLSLLDWPMLYTNGAGDLSIARRDVLSDMTAGDVLTMGDEDLSTGGTVQFVESAKMFEYDV